MSNLARRFFDWMRFRLIPWYTSLGITRGTVTLEVRGRKSGRLIYVSLTAVRRDGCRYLVSLDPDSQWLKNIRAAGGRVSILSGSRSGAKLMEIQDSEKAPILLGIVQQRAFTHTGQESSRLFFGLGPKPSLTQMEAISSRYTVLRIEPDPRPSDRSPAP